MVDFVRPLPQITETTKPFWDALKEERVRLQFCIECDRWVFYPRSNCPTCLTTDMQWREIDGLGTLYSFTVARTPPSPHFSEDVPFYIAMVDLDVGVRLTSSITQADSNEVRVGMRLQPFFDHINDEVSLLRFRPLQI